MEQSEERTSMEMSATLGAWVQALTCSFGEGSVRIGDGEELFLESM